MKNANISRLGGFTLIELLVVVLIIGILAGVALPQYEKSVERARSVEGITLARSIATANEAYFMANGVYTNDITALDLDFPGTEVVSGGIISKTVKDFECRAQAIGDTGTMSLCRRITRPYYIYYKKNTQQAYCGADSAEGEKWCRFLTSKQAAPYTFD